MEYTADELSVKERFKKRIRRYEVILCAVIVVLMIICTIIAVKTDIFYKTNFFNVPTKEFPEITTEKNEYNCDGLDIKVNDYKIEDNYMTINVTIKSGENAPVIDKSDIITVKCKTGGGYRETVYYPVNIKSETRNEKSQKITDYELSYFMPTESYDSENLIYSLRIDTESDIGIINIVYSA